MVVGRNRVGIVELSMVRTCPPRSSNNFAYNFIRRLVPILEPYRASFFSLVEVRPARAATSYFKASLRRGGWYHLAALFYRPRHQKSHLHDTFQASLSKHAAKSDDTATRQSILINI